MPKTQLILLALWREVSRHLEIGEFLQALALLLREHVPLGGVIVQRLETDHRRIHTVAASPEPEKPSAGDIHLDESQWRRLDRWYRQRNFLHKSSGGKSAESVFLLLQSATEASDWIVLPLESEHGSRGVLTMLADGRQKFSQSHVELLTALQDAVAAALDNDARLREIAALKEAAEADRQSLLNRLGRKEIGDTIVGDHSGLRLVMERVDMVSPSDVPVLILGETGTGKELVARAIHNRSDRHDGPFIRVNCGAIPRELIDSQLFGHEKGSFTGASDTRQGWFERADMGTLFLDEIGELPLDAQVRFLRVLQDGYVERVGGTKPIPVNVRVVAATHRDLASMVRDNKFREDLWYRIAVFPILLPPLRDRVEDIPALARHFADRAAIRFGLAPVMPTDTDMELLKSYDWPGNIRELAAVVDRAAILGNGRQLDIATSLGVSGFPSKHESGPLHDPRPRRDEIASLDDAIRRHIEVALRATQGRIEGASGAAQQLGVNPHTLRARMRKLRIDWARFRYLEPEPRRPEPWLNSSGVTPH